MARVDRLRALREQLDKAMAKSKWTEADKLLRQLCARDAESPRWPHKLGDLYRRLGQREQAVAAYELAVERYAASGFVARAVAMAKTATNIDPSRTDILEKVQQEPAKSIQRRSVVAAAPPEPVRLQEAAAPLAPAVDADDDEVRFEDAAQPLDLDIVLEEEDVFIDLDDVAGGEQDEDVAAERMAVLPSFTLFADLPREAMLVLADRSTLVELPPGETVVRVGEPADSLFAIVSGSVTVRVPGTGTDEAVHLTEGEIFGEACLLSDEPRHADVVVDKALSALQVPKHVLDELVEAFPEVGDVLLGMLTRRLIVNQLRTNPLFTCLDLDMRREVAHLFELRKADNDTCLSERGKRSDGMYIVLAGRLSLSDEGGSARQVSAGAVVGQSALLSPSASEVDVAVVGDALLLRLPSTRFMDLVTQYPTVLELLASQNLAVAQSG